jgi:hypothetical protein
MTRPFLVPPTLAVQILLLATWGFSQDQAEVVLRCDHVI